MFFKRAFKRNDRDNPPVVGESEPLVEPESSVEPEPSVDPEPLVEPEPSVELEQVAEPQKPVVAAAQPVEVENSVATETMTSKTMIPETMTDSTPVSAQITDDMTNDDLVNDDLADDDLADESTVEYVETMDESTILTHLLVTAMKKLDIPPSVSPNEQSKWLGEHAAIAALTAFESVFEDEDEADET